jgi:acyl-coenzyme A thioesterase PaaI-like protein
MAEIRLEVNNLCFGCGANNDRGLHMRVEREGDEWVSRLTVPAHFQGWAEIAHGGFLCTVMDEVMGWALWQTAGGGVTARMSARFLRPVPVGSPIVVRGRVTGRRGRAVRAEARVEVGDGTVAADARGLFIIMNEGAG